MKQHGFTLVELMITVVIISILAAVALPSYQENVRQSRRALAQADLMELASYMERLYTANGTYGDASTALPDSGNDFYDIDFAANEPDDDSFIIEAAPIGPQNTDTCGTLSISNTGAQGAATAGCW
jgi:type IV pilus assembly protein PilE